MKLVHYSDKPLGPIYSKEQSERLSSYGKPRGLWVSVENENNEHTYGWAEWCAAENFRDCYSQVATEITLKPDAKIIRLSTPRDIDEFTLKYSVPDPILSTVPELDSSHSRWMAIDWPAVARVWQGIIIAPYIWERRLSEHTFWYYGWDCASGCIWDKDAIESGVELSQEGRMFREEGEE